MRLADLILWYCPECGAISGTLKEYGTVPPSDCPVCRERPGIRPVLDRIVTPQEEREYSPLRPSAPLKPSQSSDPGVKIREV